MRRACAYRHARAALNSFCTAVILGVAVSAGVCACSDSQRESLPQPPGVPGLALPWPPEAQATRGVSDQYSINIPGQEAVLTGGDFVVLEDSLLLLASNHLTWGIYTLDGYFGTTRPKSVSFVRAPETEAQAGLYIGLANFAKQCWDFPSGPTDDFAEYSNGADYIGPGGKIYIAAVQWTVYDLRIMSLTVTNESDAPLPPSGLSASASTAGVQLSWEPSLGATSYRVLRSTFDENVGAYIIAPGVNGTDYLDSDAPVKTILYYSVESVGPGGISSPCDPVSANIPEIDLPAPTNLRTESHTDREAVLAWDWALDAPQYYRIYVKQEANFNLDPPFYEYSLIPGAAPTCTIDIVPGHLYWFRVAAVQGFQQGAVSECVKIETDEEWHWAPTETIGPGAGPVRLISNGSDLAATYFDGFNLLLATRDQGDWSVHDTALNKQTDVVSDPGAQDGGFFSFQDITWTGTDYFIVSKAIIAGSLWYCLGEPGDWKSGLIIGGTAYNPGGSSYGNYCEASYQNGKLGVIDSYFGSAIATGELSVSEDMGDSWLTTNYINNMAVAYQSLGCRDDNWCVLAVQQRPVNPPEPQDFVFMNSAEGMDQHIIYSRVGDLHFGLFSDLEPFGDHWLSCAYSNVDNSLYAVEGDGGDWTTTLVDGYPGGFVGLACRLAVNGDEAVMVYVDSTEGWWQMARYKDGVWTPYAILLPSAQMDDPDVVYMGGDPYVAYKDRTDNTIKCARAVPPLS